jgi:hypothetical protein
MWEKFRDWFVSDKFVWFMLGWLGSEFINYPSIINFILLGFWVWVLSTNNE